MKRKGLIAVIAGVALMALLLTKCFSKKADEYTFDTVKVEKGTITNTVTATGTLEAITTVQVGTQVSGIIEHVYADFNDYVKQGQILAKLDETALRAQLEQSQASVDQAQAQLAYQEATFNRLKALYEKNLIAQADYDQALFNYENSKASLSNSKSALDRAKVQLAYATIYSPIDGVVLNRAVEEGQTVAASFNTPEMFTIAKDLTQMEVQTSVDEADIGQVREGQRVEFTVDAYPELKFEGSVSQVRFKPVTTNNVVTYTVILNAPNPDKKLMPGMTASATIFIDEKQNTLVLSGKALRFTPDAEYLKSLMAKGATGMPAGPMPSGQMPAGGTVPAGFPAAGSFPGMPDGMKMVWVKDEKLSLKPVPVTTGIENGTSVEILSGLEQGDEVIISMTSRSRKAASARQNGGPGGPMPF
ncbi:MAG TPA: efflux RND transporter periplasmic adaptor subunit [Bacteroidales bacterium]|jgi:HlyD family secretion protein|nr:efflux RND transporter periplasmic adaptor subunit [Bacteroidales bacterium]